MLLPFFKIILISNNCHFVGNEKDRAKASAARSTTGGAVVINKEELRTIREAAQVGKQKDALMITQNELDRIKGSTVIKSKDEQIQQKKLLDEQKEQQMAAAKVSFPTFVKL